jgi:hypothetical protein
MLTRRAFNIAGASFWATAIPLAASGQQPDNVTVRIRVNDSVRQSIPLMLQQNLKIEVDKSREAEELIRNSPPARAVPIFFFIIGAMAVPVVMQMIIEALRQIYYGGVLIDLRSQPPTITSDLKIPANMVFVTGADGKLNQYKSDQLSPEVIARLFKGK